VSDHYCTSCRKDVEDCKCPTTLHWKERVAAKRARERGEGPCPCGHESGGYPCEVGTIGAGCGT